MAMYERDIKAVYESNVDDWITDQRRGLHCSNCPNEDNKKLLSNPKLPRVLCIRCFRNLLLDKASKTIKLQIDE